MTAVDNLIAELQGYSRTDFAETYIGTVATFVAALQQLQGGLVPGIAAANTVFAGPTTGAPAPPAFRVLTANELAAIITLTPGAIVFGSATGGAIPGSLFWDNTNKVLQLGGTTASFPGLKRFGATLVAALADNSDDAIMRASAFEPSGTSAPPLGLYNPDGLNTIGFSASGSNIFNISPILLQGSSSAGITLVQGSASATAPGFVPRGSSSTTGIGSQAAGNFSGIVAGAEVWRTTSTGFLMQGSTGIKFGSGAIFNDYEEGTWTPIDASPAGLTFTSVTTRYTKTGRVSNANADLTYPVTANVNNNLIGGLPFAVAGVAAAEQGFISLTSVATAVRLVPIGSSSQAQVMTAAGAPILNSALSASDLTFTALYPTT